MRWLKIVTRNVLRQRRRTILTAATVGLATFVIAVLTSVPSTIDRIVEETSKTLRVLSYNVNGRYYGLPARYCGSIEQEPGVIGCMPMVFFRGTYRDEAEPIQVFTADPEKLATLYPDYGLSEAVLTEFGRIRQGVVAGHLLIKNHGWKVGDTFTLKAAAGRLEIEFQLVGEIPANRYPNFLICRRDYLIEVEKTIGITEEKHLPTLLATRVQRADEIPRVIDTIDAEFHNSEFETATMTESDAVSGLLSAVGNIRGIVYAVAALVMLTAVSIAANSIAMMVRERIHEVALLRALGFTGVRVGGLLLAECAIIGATGGIAGSIAARLLFAEGTTLGAVLGNAGALIVTAAAAVQAVGLVVAACLLTGAVPVLSALRARPADAFRQVV